jgi:hypothetical protein
MVIFIVLNDIEINIKLKFTKNNPANKYFKSFTPLALFKRLTPMESNITVNAKYKCPIFIKFTTIN